MQNPAEMPQIPEVKNPTSTPSFCQGWRSTNWDLVAIELLGDLVALWLDETNVTVKLQNLDVLQSWHTMTMFPVSKMDCFAEGCWEQLLDQFLTQEGRQVQLRAKGPGW